MRNANILIINNGSPFLDTFIKSLQDIYSFVEEIISSDLTGSIFKEKEFNVIIYDTAVDTNNGFDTLARIRSYSKNASVIAYSDSPKASSVIELLKDGVFDYLLAPIDISRLTASIDKGIEHRKSFIEIISLNKKLIENQRTLEFETEDLKRKNRKLETLAGITKAMTGTLDLDEILYEIIHGIFNVFLFDRIFVSLVDTKRNLEEAKVAMGLEDNIYDETIKNLSWDITDNKNNPWMDELIREKKVVKVENPLEDKVYRKTRIIKYHPATFAKVPLIANGNVIGTLTIDNVNSNKAIPDDVIKTLSIFSDHAGIAIEKARLYHDLKDAHEQLKKMQKKIIEAEKLMAVNEVVASVNHEINNPLCAISLNAEMLKRKLSDENEPVRDKLEVIEQDIDRIKNIISKLANIQKIATTDYSEDTKMLDIEHSTHLEEE